MTGAMTADETGAGIQIEGVIMIEVIEETTEEMTEGVQVAETAHQALLEDVTGREHLNVVAGHDHVHSSAEDVDHEPRFEAGRHHLQSMSK
jgi:hypothetical protein